MFDPVIDVVSARPAPALRGFVEGYTGYRMEGFRPGIHRGLPGRHLTFIISLAGPVEIAEMPDRRQAPAALGAFVSGLHDGPATIAHDGNQYGIALDLTPLGARTLFGVPAGELAAMVVPLDALLGAEAGRLSDQLASAAGWVDRFAILDGVLLGVLEGARRHELRPEVAAAWARLVVSGGAVEVGALAADLGWSRRHLGERFRREIGISPKTAARIVRFERAKRLLQRASRPGLADVAATAGYYDQAHFNREWRAMAGCSPTEWLAEELPSVQDTEPLAPAGSTA